MFSIAYVVLPFANIAPEDAIRASLAPYQRGGRGDRPDDWLTFHDETDSLRRAHEARFTFTDQGEHGLRTEGDLEAHWHVEGPRVRDEMRRRGLRSWHVRFADLMDLDTFVDRFSRDLERHPVTGGYGCWRNPLGRWDWWDLGGRFNGHIIGEPNRGARRSVGKVSSGHSPGRSILSNLEDQVRAALGQAPVATIDVRSDCNVELAATLLADVRAGREQACPGALVRPPGSVEDRLRWLELFPIEVDRKKALGLCYGEHLYPTTDRVWSDDALDTWPELGPGEAFAWLGLAVDANWPEVVETSYTLFQDHWVAGIAYHH